MKQFIRIRLESISLMEKYWEMKSRLEVDGVVVLLQASRLNTQRRNRLLQYFENAVKQLQWKTFAKWLIGKKIQFALFCTLEINLNISAYNSTCYCNCFNVSMTAFLTNIFLIFHIMVLPCLKGL